MWDIMNNRYTPPVTAGDASEVFVRSKMKEGSVYFIEASEPLDHQ